MNTAETAFDEMRVTLTAHHSETDNLLLAELKCTESDNTRQSPSSKVALVIDRSSSMAGPKLQMTVHSVARLIRSLSGNDEIAVVAYDDRVDVVSGLQPPSDWLARAVEAVTPRGSTNLYEGWLTAAKIAGQGGRVLLLSDGLANRGRYQSAADLGRHAERSYLQFGVTTTTIGIGSDYDELLMSEMARKGGGSHYFAQSSDAISEAFAQERFSIGKMALTFVSLRVGQEIKQLGQFWAGETKRALFRLPRPTVRGVPMSIRFTNAASGEMKTVQLAAPSEFGHSDEATLEILIERVEELELRATHVRDPRSAESAANEIRDLILKILEHPLADSELAKAVRGRLEGSRTRLIGLSRDYDEREALLHRKRSMQNAYNLRERAKAFTSFDDERQDVLGYARQATAASAPSSATLVIHPAALELASMEDWRKWRAIPSRVENGALRVLLLNPRDGFVVAEMEKAIGMRVEPELHQATEEEILSGLDQLASLR